MKTEFVLPVKVRTAEDKSEYDVKSALALQSAHIEQGKYNPVIVDNKIGEVLAEVIT